MTEDQNTPEVGPDPLAGLRGEPPIPSALRDVSATDLAELRTKLAAFVKGRDRTISGSETPTEDNEIRSGVGDAPAPKLPTGADVDWAEYDLPFSVKHLYPRSLLRQTGDGVKWVVMLDEFHSATKSGRMWGKKVNVPGTSDGSMTEPANLGEYLSDMVNGPEGWKIVAILPGPAGDTNVVLQRQVPVALPDPRPLSQPDGEEVEAPTDEELARTEAAGLAFAAGEGLEAPPIEDEQLALPFPEDRRLPEAFLANNALALNEGTTEPAPQGEEQPDLVDDPSWPQGMVPPGVQHIRDNLSKLGDFGEAR